MSLTDHKPATLNVPRSVEGEGHKVLEIAQINGTGWKRSSKKILIAFDSIECIL